MRDRQRDKESVSTGGLLPQKDPLYFIEGPSVFTISRRTRRDLDNKELGQARDQPGQVMARIKNYATSPNEL